MACKKDLRTAAAKGDVKCLRELLRHGEDPNTRYDYALV
jgi:hypothetical protein